MPSYKVRQLRADLKEALDAAEQGEHVQVNRGKDIFLVLMAPNKNELEHALEVEAGDAPPDDLHPFINGEIEEARKNIRECSTLKMHELLDVQGSNGNWNYDPYMQGMYNGMELMLACLENRDPEYKKAPSVWLVDLPAPKTPIEDQTEPA